MATVAQLGFFIEMFHFILSLFIASLTLVFLKKHSKHLGKGAVYLLLAVLFLAIFELAEAIGEFLKLDDFLIEKTFETAVLTLLAVALLIETKASESAP